GRTERPFVTRELEKAYQHTNTNVFPRLTRKSQGGYLIKDAPPLISHLEDAERTDVVHSLLEGYKESLPDERRILFSRYRVVDLAQKVVGGGSVGTHCLIVLLLGREESDPLFLQIKEAQPSVLEPHLSRSVYPNQAQR